MWQWQLKSTGLITTIRWERLLDSATPLDPYMLWADLTATAGFGGWEATVSEHDGRWPVLIEFAGTGLLLPEEEPSGSSNPERSVEAVFGLLRIAGTYKYRDKGEPRLGFRFVSASVRPEALDQVICDPSVVRVQLGLPRTPTPADTRALNLVVEQTGQNQSVVVGLIDDGCGFAHPSVCDTMGITRVLYLWDQDRRLRDTRQPGLVSLFGYGREWQPPELARASLHAADNSDEAIAYERAGYVPVETGPDDVGTTLDRGGYRLPPGVMRKSSHGMGAMNLAAGNPAPLRNQRASASPGLPVTTPDCAGTAPIIFVQLPTKTILDTSGGSIGVHVLDGVHYLIDRADSIPPDWASLPRTAAAEAERKYSDNFLVINISYGSVAGPHDGTSMLEQALREILNLRLNTWIVVAAGNAARSRTHARLRLRPGQTGTLRWSVGPDNHHETFLEIWLPDRDEANQPLDDRDWRDVVVSVSAPGGAPVCEVRLGQAVWLSQRNETDNVDHPPQPRAQPSAAVIYARRVVHGNRGTMVLVAAGPTRPPMLGEERSRRAPAPHGDWVIEVTWMNPAAEESTLRETRPAMRVHAWTERSDLIYGNRRGQQSTVASSDPVPEPTERMPAMRRAIEEAAGRDPNLLWADAPQPLQPELSLASLSGLSLERPGRFYEPSKFSGAYVVVGGHRIADGEMATYSGGGPSRDLDASRTSAAEPSKDPFKSNDSRPRYGPDVDAPSDISPALRGLRVAGLRPGAWARLGGTSASAPSVTRFIVNMLHPDGACKSAAARSLSAMPATEADAGRPTMTPRKDDLYRRGRNRLE
jgi:hypothetical protein